MRDTRDGQAARPLVLTVVGRSYCHLCDEMQEALQLWSSTHAMPVSINCIDLDDQPELEANFGERIPVLLLGDDHAAPEICFYRFDEIALSRALAIAPSNTHSL